MADPPQKRMQIAFKSVRMSAPKTSEQIEKETKKTPAEMAEKKILNDLAASINTQARSATFACGGSVSFVEASEVIKKTKPLDRDTDDSETHKVSPIQIRFGESGKGVTVVLPGAQSSSKEFEALLAACKSASFGRDGEEVLDEDYRKAGKLDVDYFATNFCPYEAGIIDVGSQLLLPQTSQDKHMRSLRAELYKLNVYSAPSGKFKPHVDTPRAKSQVGSLVVALPLNHLGGSLAVRHLGKEMLFDWSTPKATSKIDSTVVEEKHSIQWAAFYKDCEHEVYEVTSGHRVTLTYNLYVCRGKATLPELHLCLTQRNCHCRILGIWLNHSYAHTSKHLNFLPNSLKGADMSLYETALALNLECNLVPIISLSSYHNKDPEHLFTKDFYPFNGGRSVADEGHPTDGWGVNLSRSKIMWLNSRPGPKRNKKIDKDKTEAEKADEKAKTAADTREVQLSYLTYGNEPDIDIHYSRAAMFIRLPRFYDRGSSAKPNESLVAAMRSRGDYYDEDSYDSEEDYDEEDGEDEDMWEYQDEGEEVKEEEECPNIITLRKLNLYQLAGIWI